MEVSVKSFLRKINTFLHTDYVDKLLFFEAVITSAYVRFTLSFLEFKKVMNWLGKKSLHESVAGNDKDFKLVCRVKTAIFRCNNYTFWKTECYTQALTAKILLRRRNISSVLTIGFMKDEAGNYKGHAWLKCGDTVVTGNLPKLSLFQINASFS